MNKRFETFTVLIANISRSIRKIKTEEMAEFELKSHHVSCIYYLYKLKKLTSKELCDICTEDKANVSRSLNFLEDSGYLMPSSKSNKRYQCSFELTEKGLIIGKQIAEKIDGILSSVGEGLDEQSRITMYRCLNIINNNLQKLCNEHN